MKWLKEKLKSNEKINLEDVIKNNGNDIPLLKELIKTEQDPEWHSEGNVHVHTNMVINELYKIFDENSFSLNDKYILLMSAIFHDIAKPLTSKWKEVRGVEHLTARNHEYEGLSYLFYKFSELDIDSESKKHILNIVGFHQMPKMLVVNNKLSHEWNYKFLTEETAGYLFYYLELADMRGRITKDYETQLEYIELFKIYAIDYNCFNQKSGIEEEIKNVFKNDYNEQNEKALSYLIGKTKKRWHEDNNVTPHIIYNRYYEKKDNHSIFYVLSGLSGSGKTTAVNKIMLLNDKTKIVELDSLRLKHKIKRNNRQEIDSKVRQESKELIKKYIREGFDVIYDACNLRFDFREMVSTLAEEYFAKTVLVFVDTPMSVCIKNDKARSVRTVGQKVIESQVKSFQYPLKNEFNEIFVF